METSERFNRAIDALVTAFFNDTLAKGHCDACAVGNICAFGQGVKVIKHGNGNWFSWSEGDSNWQHIFYTYDNKFNKPYQIINPKRYEGEVKVQIDATGYSWKQLAEIERVYELNTKIDYGDYPDHAKDEIMNDQYNGLMAVVEVLCEIEGIDATETKHLFEFAGV